MSNKWNLKCDNNKKLLEEYGVFVAEENNIQLSKIDIENFIDKILSDHELIIYYNKNKNIFKESVFNFICFGY